MTENIPILDLSNEITELWDELNGAIQDVLRSTQFIMGQPVKDLEAQIADYLGTKHAIAMNSGTDALVIGLRALGVEAGDEVITTPFTFFATGEAISLNGAKTVFADIDPKTFNIDVEQVAEKITPNTKAIIPVHLFGHAAQMDELMALAQEHDLKIVEDTAQGFGADYKDKKLGTIGNIGTYSFFPTKNLGAYGDGGMLTTDDDDLAEVVRMLRVHGAKKKYHNEILGYNSRLDTMQAAILGVKLPHVPEWNNRRRQAAQNYQDLLGNLDGITLPSEELYACHIYHQYTIRVHDGRRDEVKQKLADKGIGSMIYYPIPMHQLPYYNETIALPHSEKAAQEVLSLPMWSHITSEKQEQVAKVLRQIIQD